MMDKQVVLAGGYPGSGAGKPSKEIGFGLWACGLVLMLSQLSHFVLLMVFC